MMPGFIMEKWGLSFCSIIIDDIPGGWCTVNLPMTCWMKCTGDAVVYRLILLMEYAE